MPIETVQPMAVDNISPGKYVTVLNGPPRMVTVVDDEGVMLQETEIKTYSGFIFRVEGLSLPYVALQPFLSLLPAPPVAIPQGVPADVAKAIATATSAPMPTMLLLDLRDCDLVEVTKEYCNAQRRLARKRVKLMSAKAAAVQMPIPETGIAMMSSVGPETMDDVSDTL